MDRWLAAYPTELPNRVEIDPRMLNTNTNQTIRNSGGSFRMDWQVTSDHTFSLRYSMSDVFIDSFEFVDGLNPNQSLRPQNLNISTESNLSSGDDDKTRRQLSSPENSLARTSGSGRTDGYRCPAN